MPSYEEFKIDKDGDYIPVESEGVTYKPVSTTDGRLSIISEKSLQRLEMQFVPSELNIDVVPNIGEIAIVGRNTPRYQNTGGKVTMNFELDFYANDEDRQDVIAKCTWLQSMAVNDGDIHSADRVIVNWGDLFKSLYGRSRWVIKSAPAKYSNFNPKKGWLPQQAYVALSLELDADKNLNRRDFRWDLYDHYGLSM